MIAGFNILNKDNASSTVTADSTVEAILKIPEKSDNTNIYPGYKSFKEYIVKGKGNNQTLPSQASIIAKPNLGDVSKYVYWSLYKSNEEITCTNTLNSSGTAIQSTCNIPESAKLVLSENADNTHIGNIPK